MSRELKFNEQHVRIKSDVHSGTGLAAIVTSPHAMHFDDFHARGYSPDTHSAVVIAHGNGGHKSYCYHALLAERLAAERGMFSIRFDFRACGDSEPNADDAAGRTIDQDIADLDAVVAYATSGGYKGIALDVTAIVAHSRGTAAMFLWSLQRQQAANAAPVPSLVNCAGRFDYSRHVDKIRSTFPDWAAQGYYDLPGVYRDGALQTVRIPRRETLSLSEVDLADVRHLDSSVLSIYGLEDTQVPLQDAASFANALGERHELRFIAHADHNFYGDNAAAAAADAGGAEGTEGTATPKTSKGKYNYNPVVVETVLEFLSHAQELQRFYRRTERMSAVSRWKHVDGIANFRDVGGWRVGADEYVRAGRCFRCALPSRVTERGKQTLRELEVAAVFDFRSSDELRREGVLQVEGITNFHVPVMKSAEKGSPQDLMLQYKNLIVSWATYRDIYRDMLRDGVDAYRAVFTHIRDHPHENIVFHCSAGKDRTGLMAMLLLALCGVDRLTIAREYELTTVGLRPLHAAMRRDFDHSLRRHGDSLPRFEAACAMGRANWTLHTDGFANIVSSRCEAMLATLDMFDTEFGGVRQYLRDMGFSAADIDTIRSNLVMSRASL